MKKLITLCGLVFVALNYSAQTLPNTENYVETRTYLDPVTSSSTTAKQIHVVQYFDGLGRAKQVVNVKASPQGKDVVTHVEYDGFGRQTKDYLPIPQSGTNNGAMYASPLANASTVYGSEKIYAEKILENSPLDRIQQQIQVGTAWATHPVAFGYDANIGSDYVRKYETTTTWINGATNTSVQLLQYFQPNQLYKKSVTDEDGNTSIEFTNGQGQTILVRKVLNSTQNTDTYYVYNEYDQLAFVVPPLASAPTVEATTMENLYYQYRYDGRNRLVEKKLPGKGWENIIYDNQDRIVATQDANLRLQNQWLYTKYDQFGRVAITGIGTGGSRETEQTMVNGLGSNNVNRISYVFFNRQGMDVYYDNPDNTYPNSTKWVTLLSLNYYDAYPIGTPTIPTQVLGQNVLSQDAQNSNISTKSLPTASYVKNIEDDNWTKAYTWYDTKGRPIGSHSINHLGGFTETKSLLDFAGVVQQSFTYHSRATTTTEVTIEENFIYDPQNRLITHKHKVNGGNEEVLTQNTYNELSQLQNKKVGGTTLGSGLQTVKYQYNIRGWMTRINDPNNLGTDLFGYKIKYNQVEGLATPDASDTALQVTPKYNGNIAEIDWKTSTQENEPLQRYGYVYDSMNRLLSGFYQKETSPSARAYFEKLTYDLNGNISTLKRTAQQIGPSTSLMIDNLTYQYQAANNSNRLQKITETTQNSLGYPYKAIPTDIGYDDNGNMTTYLDKKISSIQYNYLNLPKQITQNSVATNYTYRADGAKVKKLFGTVQTDYLDGFQYKYTEPWEDETGTLATAQMKLRIIPTSEGYYDALLGLYVYNYADHLGNIRISYADSDHDGSIRGRDQRIFECFGGENCIDYFIPGEIVANNTYYPFGMLFDHNAQAQNSNAYKYKFQDQELQETGFYSFKWRQYMPDVGRFFNVDPLSEVYAYQSHYNFSENRVVDAREIEGLEAQILNDAGDMSINGYSLSHSEYTTGSDGTINIQEVVVKGTQANHWNNLNSILGDYASGVGDGFGNYFSSSWNAITHPVETFNNLRNYQPDPVKDLVDPLLTGLSGGMYGTLKNNHQNMMDVANGDIYSPGERLGGLLGELTTTAAGGALGRIGKIGSAAKTSSNVLLNTSRQLQAKFKHAGDFGVLGNYSKANAGKFSGAINQHINSAGIQTINGTYRGQSVIHYLNPNTGLNVISNPAGQFISGWKLNPAQLQNVLQHGGL